MVKKRRTHTSRRAHNTIAKPNKSRTTPIDQLRAGKIAVDIKHTQQELLRPFTPFPFDLTTTEGFTKFTHELIQAGMRHEIDGRVGGFINGVVQNYIRYTQPTEHNVNVNVNVDLAALQKKVDEMKPEDESVVIEAINRLGSAPSTEKT